MVDWRNAFWFALGAGMAGRGSRRRQAAREEAPEPRDDAARDDAARDDAGLHQIQNWPDDIYATTPSESHAESQMGFDARALRMIRDVPPERVLCMAAESAGRSPDEPITRLCLADGNGRLLLDYDGPIGDGEQRSQLYAIFVGADLLTCYGDLDLRMQQINNDFETPYLIFVDARQLYGTLHPVGESVSRAVSYYFGLNLPEDLPADVRAVATAAVFCALSHDSAADRKVSCYEPEGDGFDPQSCAAYAQLRAAAARLR